MDSAKDAELISAFQTQNRYTYKKRLGSGGFGQVVLATDNWQESKPEVAIKLLDRSQIDTGRAKYIRGEIENHSRLCHELVIQFIDVLTLGQWLGIVMEYAAGGSLLEYLNRAGQPLPEDTARYLFRQLIIAVDYCHRRQVASRDIKLPNILLQPRENGHVCLKLCDFGHSKGEEASNANSVVGTIIYMAPEVYEKGLGLSKDKTYSPKTADVWACGVVLYTMLFGRYPYLQDHNKPPEDLLQKMRTCCSNLSAKIVISKGCQDLLQKMFNPNPAHRITLANIMAHEWFTNGLPAEFLQVNEKCVNQQGDLPTQEMRDHINRVLDQAETRTLKSYISGKARYQGQQYKGAVSAEPVYTTAMVTPGMFSNP